jgi:HSP20 family molecular chaperone IbpA
MVMETAQEPSHGGVARQVGRLMDQFQKGFFSFCPLETWTPSVNLYENDTAYYVCVDLAGVDKEKIDLVVTHGQLRLRGQRAAPTLAATTQSISWRSTTARSRARWTSRPTSLRTASSPAIATACSGSSCPNAEIPSDAPGRFRRPANI